MSCINLVEEGLEVEDNIVLFNLREKLKMINLEFDQLRLVKESDIVRVDENLIEKLFDFVNKQNSLLHVSKFFKK